jgi:hypothetical protein
MFVPTPRANLLSAQYGRLFVGVPRGQWVELPADCRPVPGDHVKVVDVPHGDPYEDQIGVWHGPNRNVDGWGNPGLRPRCFRMSQLHVVLRKWW